MEIFMQIDSTFTEIFEWDVSNGGNFEMGGIPIEDFELKESIFHVKRNLEFLN